MAIDKQTASTLYGYSYKLKDSEGNVWNVDGVHAGKLILYLKGKRKVIGCSFDKIGTTYKILARPLGMLTKEIEGKVPLIELFKVALQWCYGYEIDFKIGVCDTDDVTHGLTAKYSGVDYGFSLDHDPSINWVEFRFTADSYDMRLNQLALFDKLKEWHFNIGFPENTTTDLI